MRYDKVVADKTRSRIGYRRTGAPSEGIGLESHIAWYGRPNRPRLGG